MSLNSFFINSKLKKYKVYFMSDRDFIEKISLIPNSFFIIDSNVWKYYGNNILSFLDKKDKVILKSDEENKNFNSVFKIYEKIFEINSKKNTNIVALGGGILQDVAGFAASTIYRGINWFFIPTTSLAQIDSCIGGKTSLNYKKHKNLIGTFYPPSEIYININFLKTLRKDYYYSGIGEMIKLFIISGLSNTKIIAKNIKDILSANNEKLLSEYIKKSLLIKKKYIESDEFDKGIRNILNYGHCFGHALEGATNFSISHGLAITVGMIIANKVSLDRKLIDENTFVFVNECILKHISSKIKNDNFKNLSHKKIISFMRKDKKRTGADLSMVLMKKDYNFELFSNIKEEEVVSAMNWLFNKKRMTYFV